MELIENGRVVEDRFTQLQDAQPIAERGDILVSFERLQGQHEALLEREGRLGVRIGPDVEPEELLPYLSQLSVIAIEFASFADGRGYSTARLLRQRHGYRGQLRAVGNVLRDQLFYMKRCGFDAFELQAGRSLDDALEAFSEFSVIYQGAADEPLPLFRRR
ncbi:MAG: DUF934 domain-containing protein [Myxococcales bacterium]|nr:DUF934 domain-containing protein [Myxococcales bacterium]